MNEIVWMWGNLPQSDMSKIYEVIFGISIYQNISPDGKKIIIQLKEGDVPEAHPVLNSFKQMTHQEAVEMAATWRIEPN